MPSVKLAEYLFTRLTQLGVISVFGVPGDYNLALLDYVEPQGLHWVGNCNELNAGYAADAYSRIKGLGALITTFGVGELSAANAIAGAYAELAPLVHIVGTPARQSQQSRALVHHTLNDGDYRRFAQMSSHITVAQASLLDPRTCPQLIDSTIQQCLIHSRPVYIELPADMVDCPVDAEPLKKKIELPKPAPSKDEADAIALVLDRIYTSKQPMILVDGESRAYGILDEIDALIKSTQFPTWTTIFGKSCVDETLENVHGIWKGNAADESDRRFVDGADLILCFGPHFSQTNTYGYSSVPAATASILFKANSLEANQKIFRDLPARNIVSTLLRRLDLAKLKQPPNVHIAVNGTAATLTAPSNGLLTQDLFYKRFNRFLRSGDVVLAETGTAGHGCRDFGLPRGTVLFKPSTWLSIGYMLPASLGAGLAQRELHNAEKWSGSGSEHGITRTILLIGDGSFQMTAQELSTIIKEKLNVLLILINNDGYTIERCLHGWNQSYNDIVSWRYLQAPALFGASDRKEDGYHARTFQVRTWQELDEIMEDELDRPSLKMVEVFMRREDAPVTLATLLQRQKDAAGGAK